MHQIGLLALVAAAGLREYQQLLRLPVSRPAEVLDAPDAGHPGQVTLERGQLARVSDRQRGSWPCRDDRDPEQVSGGERRGERRRGRTGRTGREELGVVV